MPRSPWPAHALSRWNVEHPIIQAPMAGGPATPALVAAASEAGCLGSLGAAYMTPEAIRAAGHEIRSLTPKPFAINLFLPEHAEASGAAIARMQALLDPFREAVGAPLSPPIPSREHDFEAQLQAVLDVAPAVVSFVFGCPDDALVSRLKAAGIAVMGTATCVREAIALEAVGLDAIVAQGAEAGGHRGTFPGAPDPLIGTMALVPQVVDHVRVPVIAAGGLMDGRGIVAALALGAGAVQMGTAFLTAREAGTSAPHRAALKAAHDDATAITRAFSGRPARGIRNRYMDAMAAHDAEVLPFPLQNALTRGMRTAAAARGEADYLSLWAGQGLTLRRDGTVAELVSGWVQQAEEVMACLHGAR
ncbi:MAG TPA: nitronate monooxygenase [Oscillatoriaceae cyanobacterium]